MIIQKLSKEECLNFPKGIKFGRLGCVRDKQPYVIPIYFVSDGKHIYAFTTLGQKIRWLRENSLVCVEADQERTTPRSWVESMSRILVQFLLSAKSVESRNSLSKNELN